MRTLGNILWLVLCGFWLAISYAVAGLLMLCPIVTIPLAVQSFKLAGYVLWPFGRVVVDKPTGSTGLSAIGNVIWFVLAGLWIAIEHVLIGVLFCITIIGIPFGVANFKLAGLAIWPFGKMVVPASIAGPGGFVIHPLGTTPAGGSSTTPPGAQGF
jgi:uncharacterized membrane protein YccF (DUF307 family)